MLYLPTLISIVEVLLVTVPVLLTVAYVTVAERKTMASMQRRLGPNIVGYFGLLQAFADALKLLLKEYVSPTQANLSLFFLGPIITLIFSLLGYLVVPYGPGLALSDFNLGILYMLAVSSLATYGILLAGWSANSKYAFLGSLRSTAQLISYELILSSAILLVVMLTGSLNLTVNIEAQRAVWFIIPLFPVFIIFFIGAVAETNRAPFDLAEASHRLVSCFIYKHRANTIVFLLFALLVYMISKGYLFIIFWCFILYFNIIRISPNCLYLVFVLEEKLKGSLKNISFNLFLILLIGFILLLLTFYDSIVFMNQDAGGNSGSTSGGQSNPGGATPPTNNDGSLAVASGGIPHSNTDNSINSNVSYTTDDLKQTAGSEFINVKNILQDKTLSEEDRNNKVLKAFADLQKELIDAKRDVKNLKTKGEIPIVFKR